MADQSRKPNRKRQHKSEQKPATKRQKRNGCEKTDNGKQLLAMPAQPIYYLDEIFPDEILIQLVEGFSLKELFEFGRASPAFGPVVEEIYGKKYNGVPVKLHFWNIPLSKSGILEDHTEIEVLGTDTCIWYLKIFGKKIIQIEIKGRKFGIRRINQLLAEHCADSLENIKYSDVIMDSGLHPIFDTRPLNNVNTVSFRRLNLYGHLQSISSFFPNVRCLSLDNTTESNIAVNFPNLRELTIKDSSAKGALAKIQSMLNSNNSVSTLIIKINDRKRMALSTILKAIPKSASITELMVDSLPATAATPLNVIKKLIREQGQLTKLDLNFHKLQVDGVIELLTNSNLTEIKYYPVHSSDKTNLMQTLPLLNARGTWTDVPTKWVSHLRLIN